MSKAPQWLEELLETKLAPLDRRPVFVSAMLTLAIMVAATYGGDSFTKVATHLWPVYRPLSEPPPYYNAVIHSPQTMPSSDGFEMNF